MIKTSSQSKLARNSPHGNSLKLQITNELLDWYLFGKKKTQNVDISGREKIGSKRKGSFSEDKYNRKIKLLWCEKCSKHIQGECPIHGGLSPKLTYAVRSFPPEIRLCTSSISGCKFGACARSHIPRGTWIGPYEGRRVYGTHLEGNKDNDYAWEIYENGKFSHFLDGSDENLSSWMRFIRCARNKIEQNMAVFQYGQNIYYRAMCDISVGEEILVWYDHTYTQVWGIPIAMNKEIKPKGKGTHPNVPAVASHANLASFHGPKLLQENPPSLTRAPAFPKSQIPPWQSDGHSLLTGPPLPPTTRSPLEQEVDSTQPLPLFPHEQRSPAQPVQRSPTVASPSQLPTITASYDVNGEPQVSTQHRIQPSFHTTQPYHSPSTTLTAHHVPQSPQLPPSSSKLPSSPSAPPQEMPTFRVIKSLAHSVLTQPQCSQVSPATRNIPSSEVSPCCPPPVLIVPSSSPVSQISPQFRFNPQNATPPGFVTPSTFPRADTDRSERGPRHVSTSSACQRYMVEVKENMPEGMVTKADLQLKSVNIAQSSKSTPLQSLSASLNIAVTSPAEEPGQNDVSSTVNTNERNPDSWKCGQCAHVFGQRLSLQAHVCPRGSEKPFQCGHCSMAFAHAELLRAHVVTHSNDRPFKCGFCGRSFVGATTLSNHMRAHTGERPFVCEKCEKTFSTATQLSRHIKQSEDCGLLQKNKQWYNTSNEIAVEQ